MTKYIDIDFETRSIADIKSVGSAKYSLDKTTSILIVSFWPWDYPEVINFSPYSSDPKNSLSCRRLNRYLALVAKHPSLYKLRAHNSEFEYWIYNRIGVDQFGWPELPLEAFDCTMTLAGANSYPLKESSAAESMRLAEKKDKEGEKLIKFFSNPSSKEVFRNPADYPDMFRQFISYCDQDVRTQRAIAEYCEPLNFSQKRGFFLTEKMNLRGLPIDRKLAEGAIELTKKYTTQLDQRVCDLTDGFVGSARQTKVLTDWLNATYQLNIPNLQAATVDRFLARSDLDFISRELLEIRQQSSKTSTAKYAKALELITDSDKVHGSLKSYLAITGRWKGRGLQIQNFSKPDFRMLPDWDDYDIEEVCQRIQTADLDKIQRHYGDPMAVLSAATRALICAPEGYKLISADFSQVEARITMWLAGSRQGLDDFKGEGKIYEKMAASIFGLSAGDIQKGSFQRDVGKESVLGCGFGMGEQRFYDTCTQERGLNVSRQITDDAVRAYRARYHEVPRAWNLCENAAKKAIQHPEKTYSLLSGRVSYKFQRGTLQCTLPSGRRIYYPESTIKLSLTPWDVEVPKIFYKNWKDTRGAGKQWDYTEIWGGTLFEHIVQASAVDLITTGMLAVEAAGYDVIFTVHDESVSLVPEGFGSVEEYEKLLCTLPRWGVDIPLVAEGWQGRRYRK